MLSYSLLFFPSIGSDRTSKSDENPKEPIFPPGGAKSSPGNGTHIPDQYSNTKHCNVKNLAETGKLWTTLRSDVSEEHYTPVDVDQVQKTYYTHLIEGEKIDGPSEEYCTPMILEGQPDHVNGQLQSGDNSDTPLSSHFTGLSRQIMAGSVKYENASTWKNQTDLVSPTSPVYANVAPSQPASKKGDTVSGKNGGKVASLPKYSNLSIPQKSLDIVKEDEEHLYYI